MELPGPSKNFTRTVFKPNEWENGRELGQEFFFFLKERGKGRFELGQELIRNNLISCDLSTQSSTVGT
jgi:hypothetical protein